MQFWEHGNCFPLLNKNWPAELIKQNFLSMPDLKKKINFAVRM